MRLKLLMVVAFASLRFASQAEAQQAVAGPEAPVVSPPDRSETTTDVSTSTVAPVGTAERGTNEGVALKSPSAVLVASPSVDGASVAIQSRPGAQQVAVIKQVYDEARKKLGGEHVLLTAIAYASRDCGAGHCGKTQGGVAGVVSLPLFGAGGGHGGDWYPVLQTEDATRAFERFQSEVKLYVETLDSAHSEELDSAIALRVLKDAANTLLDQVSEDDPSTWEFAQAVRACIVRLDDTTATSDEHGKKVQTEDDLVKESLWHTLRGSLLGDTPDVVNELFKACSDAGRNIAGKNAGEKVAAEIAAIRAMLRAYWKKLPVDQQAPRRHTLLLGPALGFPISRDPTDVVLAGGFAELGANAYFRVGLSGGAQFRYSNLEKTPGWFAGLAISGAFGDDLIHWLNGGLSAARKLQALP